MPEISKYCGQLLLGASHRKKKSLLLSLAFIFTLIITETIVGLLSGSLSIISEAIHLLTDFIALCFTYLSYLLTFKKYNPKYSYGYSRIAIISALINSGVLLAVSSAIAFEAIKACIYGAPEITHINVVLATAVIGFFINAAIIIILGSGHNHDLNTRSVVLHVASDLLGNISVIVSAVVIKATGWAMIDPVMSIAIFILILRNTYPIVAKALSILLEGTPNKIDHDKVTNMLKTNVPEIDSVNHLHIWALDEDNILATLNVRLKNTPEGSPHVLLTIKKLLHSQFGITHTTIELGSNGA